MHDKVKHSWRHINGFGQIIQNRNRIINKSIHFRLVQILVQVCPPKSFWWTKHQKICRISIHRTSIKIILGTKLHSMSVKSLSTKRARISSSSKWRDALKRKELQHKKFTERRLVVNQNRLYKKYLKQRKMNSVNNFAAGDKLIIDVSFYFINIFDN